MTAFEKEWVEHFAKGFSKSMLKKYVTGRGNFIWHVFSWKLLDVKTFLVGDEARKAFDDENKKGARYYEKFSECSTPDEGLELASYITASEIDKIQECYVVAKDNSWTYIKTHEGDYCGPYFYKPKC